jgi:hypothetical protein
MATATRVRITPQDYLSSVPRPDCDLLNGELQERNVGEFEHAFMQACVSSWFLQHLAAWSLIPLSEMRTQIAPDRYRVVDVAVVSKDAVREPVLKAPPFIVIEILSPEDRVGRYRERLEDYRKMGVRNIRVVDPVLRECWDCSSGAWIPTERLEVAGTAIYLDLSELPI